jgi:type IV secretory pathway VirJ component
LSSDASLQNSYLTPLSEIVGILGKIYLNESKWSAIFQSVKEASPRIDILLNSLESDIVNAEQAYRNIAQNNAAALNNYYSQNRASMSKDDRKRILDAYEYYNTMQTNLELVKTSDGTRSSKAVNGLITPIRTAHSKLANLSSSSQYDVIAEIRALLETYDTELQEIKELILTYKQK